MRVGSVVDCWAVPGEAFAVVNGRNQKCCEQQGFDLILTNQSHQKWCEAIRTAGYLAGPSNFIFAASKKLAALLAPFEQIRPRMHLYACRW